MGRRLPGLRTYARVAEARSSNCFAGARHLEVCRVVSRLDNPLLEHIVVLLSLIPRFLSG